MSVRNNNYTFLGLGIKEKMLLNCECNTYLWLPPSSLIYTLDAGSLRNISKPIQVPQKYHVNLLSHFGKGKKYSAIFQCNFCTIILPCLRRMLVVGQILLHLTLRYFPPNTIAFMKISANKLKRQEFIRFTIAN